MYYGLDSIDPYRRARRYVDRMLKGEKPGDLPVHNRAHKVELVINMKTASRLVCSARVSCWPIASASRFGPRPLPVKPDIATGIDQ